MPKLFSVLLLVLLSFSAFAQDTPTIMIKGEKPQYTPPDAAVLYEQMSGVGTNSITSQNFEATYDVYDNQGADDFSVPAGDTWTIESVEVAGAYFNGAGPTASYNVFFYSAGSFPGTLVAQALNSAYTDPTGLGAAIITISPVIVLPAGSYWVSVQCNMDLVVGGQWGWTEHTAVGSESAWQNPGGGFGTPCTTWGYRVTNCAVGSAPYYDLAFRLNGTPGPGNIFFDDFEAYIAGQQLACQNPTDWTTWSNAPCGPEDAYISSNYAYSGVNSAVIASANDLVKPLGNQTSGKWYISFLVYIPAGKDGYFNTLTGFTPDPYEWAHDCFFDAGGAGRLDLTGGGGGGTIVNFTWAVAQWNQVVIIVDLDSPNSPAEFWMGTNPSNFTQWATWDWTNGGTKVNRIAANDFYGFAATSEMYFDDYYFGDVMPPIIPVELVSFAATASEGLVELSWITATEINNQGFEVQRSIGSEFETIAFIEGHGTTTETQVYSYSDRNVSSGSYSYRLRQIDFDGTFEYSNVVEVDVPVLTEFALDQNYPNPFNPSTTINFRLAVDSKVSMKVFNVLGQEVASLLNGNLVAGSHNVNFDASSLNSGVYMYRIEATGIDGTNFVDVKKMILTK